MHIVPLGELCLESCGAVQFYREVFLAIGFLRGDENDTVRSPAAVQGRCCRPLEYRQTLDIIGIDARYSVAEIESSPLVGTVEIGVVHRYAVYHIQWLVIACKFGASAEYHPGGTCGPRGRLRHGESGHLPGQRVDYIHFFGFLQLLALYLSERVAQCLAVALDSKGGDDHFVDLVYIFLEYHPHRSALCDFHFLRYIPDVAYNERGIVCRLKTKPAVHVSDRACLGAFDHYACTDDGLVARVDNDAGRPRCLRCNLRLLQHAATR